MAAILKLPEIYYTVIDYIEQITKIVDRASGFILIRAVSRMAACIIKGGVWAIFQNIENRIRTHTCSQRPW